MPIPPKHKWLMVLTSEFRSTSCGTDNRRTAAIQITLWSMLLNHGLTPS